MPKVTTVFTVTTPLRQAVFYALLFAGTGASLPFMPLWLKAHGMTAAQIGLILAVPLLLRAITGPLSGVWADRFTLYRTPIALLAAAGAAFYVLIHLGTVIPAAHFALYLLFFALGFSCLNAASPLTDAMTLQLARRDSFAYAIPRAVGSAAFIATNIVLGFLLVFLPSDTIVIWMAAAAAATALGARYLLAPDTHHDAPHAAHPRPSGLKRLAFLMRNRGFVVLVVAVGCIQAAHSFYYAFSTIIWKERGLSSATCGYLWATGVAGEIAFMALGEGLRRRLGPWRLLILAGLCGVVRWSVMMTLPPVWLLWPLQMLHAMTFAATYLAGLDLVHRLTPKGYEGLAQTLNAAYTSGLMLGIGTLASGAVYAVFGARGYGLMAVIAAIGTLSAIWLYLERDKLTSAVNPTTPASPDAA